MSRSRRKTPIVGHTTCGSEREDKKLWHQRWRTRERTALTSASSAMAEAPWVAVIAKVRNAMRRNAKIMFMANALNDAVAFRTDRCDNPYLLFISARWAGANGDFYEAYIDATAWFRPRDLAW